MLFQYWMDKIFGKKRKGTTLIETVIALSLLSSAVVLMTRLTALKINEQKGIDSQYVLVLIDSFFSDLYTEYQESTHCDIVTDDGSGLVSIVLDLGSKGISIYEYMPGVPGEVKHNGSRLFTCREFTAIDSGDNIYIAVKVEDARQLSMHLYK